MKTSSTIKETFRQWCQITTCAGVVDFSLARSWYGKLFWLCVIFPSLIGTIWQTHNVFDDFLYGKPYETSLSAVYGDSPYFPNVTVCNYNRIKNSTHRFLSTHGLSYAFAIVSLDYFSLYNPTTLEHLRKYEEAYSDMMRVNHLKSVKDLFLQFGYSCEETFVGCQWNMIPFNCCERATEVITGYGRCWTVLQEFSDEEVLKQNFQGSNYGLKLLINPNLDTYLEDVVINNLLETGVIIDASYYKNAIMPDTKSLAPGSRVWIELQTSLNQFEVSSNPIRPPPCQANGTIKYLDVNYTVDNCFADCWYEYVFIKVGCVPFGPIRQQYAFCEPKQMLEFQIYARQLMRNHSTLLTRLTSCRKECKLPCEKYWEIKTTLIWRKFLDQSMTPNLLSLTNQMFPNANLSTEALESLINVNVYFSTAELSYAVTSERNPLFSFVSNVGGQLSLWLGISIITIIQCLFYVFSCIWDEIVKALNVIRVNTIRFMKHDSLF